MQDKTVFRDLFGAVLSEEQRLFGTKREYIKEAMINIGKHYMCTSLENNELKFPNYDEPHYRCAYLHKFALCHTTLLSEILKENVLETNQRFFEKLLENSNHMKLCCLGGGPGTDVIAVLSVICGIEKTFKISATVVDIFLEWKVTFNLLIKELRSNRYGSLERMVRREFFEWEYVKANLLSDFTAEAKSAISSANLITMVKFLSAAATVDTKNMVERIFEAMKPGAVVLFIDNAGGGYHQLMQSVANQHRFLNLMEPINWKHYRDEDLKKMMFGIHNCFNVEVAVYLLKKRAKYNLDFSTVLPKHQRAEPPLRSTSLSDLSHIQSKMQTNQSTSKIQDWFKYEKNYMYQELFPELPKIPTSASSVKANSYENRRNSPLYVYPSEKLDPQGDLVSPIFSSSFESERSASQDSEGQLPQGICPPQDYSKHHKESTALIKKYPEQPIKNKMKDIFLTAVWKLCRRVAAPLVCEVLIHLYKEIFPPLTSASEGCVSNIRNTNGFNIENFDLLFFPDS